MSKVNVRRGAFRLWVVGSVLWVLGIGLVSVEGIQDAFKQRAEYDSFEKMLKDDTPLVPVLCGDARGQLHKDYDPIIPTGSPPPSARPNPFDTCWYELKVYRRLYPEQHVLSDDELFQKTYSDAGQQPPKPRPRPWSTVWEAVLDALAAPVVVLLVGAALFWALAGFKRGSEAETT